MSMLLHTPSTRAHLGPALYRSIPRPFDTDDVLRC